jgi:hypothetical protein
VLAGPLFQGGQLRAQYRASKAKFDEVRAAYEQSALTALPEVSNALIARQKLGEIHFYDEQAAVALTSSVDLATQRYLNGRSSYYEVLQAQQELYPTQRAQVQAQVGEWSAVVQLYKALGGGWKRPRSKMHQNNFCQTRKSTLQPNHRNQERKRTDMKTTTGKPAATPKMTNGCGLSKPIPRHLSRGADWT